MTYENYDVLVGIDARGVAHVLKHRTQSTKNVKAEVTLTTTFVRTEKFATEEADTGLFQPRSATAAEGQARLVSARVAVDPAGIRALLLDAAALAPNQHVLISGTKVDGTYYEKRRVLPLSLPGNTHLLCDTADGARTFTLANIDRAEFA